jgi:putative SOS response-associated peptidase YedK
MCGRYSRSADAGELIRHYGLAPDESLALTPRYNIGPGQEATVIVQEERPRLELMRWGLVPSWAKDERSGFHAINARAETIAQKPMFKESLTRRRCLIPADGYYEWMKKGRQKMPWRFMLNSGGTFSFAGLWDAWQKPDGQTLYTFSIITTKANELAHKVHDRMPVILHQQDEARWLGGGDDLGLITSLLQPYPSDQMRCYSVSPAVNSIANQGPELIKPLESEPVQAGFDFMD